MNRRIQLLSIMNIVILATIFNIIYDEVSVWSVITVVGILGVILAFIEDFIINTFLNQK